MPIEVIRHPGGVPFREVGLFHWRLRTGVAVTTYKMNTETVGMDTFSDEEREIATDEFNERKNSL